MDIPITRGRRAVAGCIATAGFLALTGCFGDEGKINGAAGITMSADGHPTVVIAVCSDYIDQVTLWNGHDDSSASEPNKQVGSWNAVKHLTSAVQLDLVEAGPEWKPHPAATFEDDGLYVVIPYRTDKDVESTQVSFYGKSLASLKPGTVYVDKNIDDSELTEASSVADFQHHICG